VTRRKRTIFINGAATTLSGFHQVRDHPKDPEDRHRKNRCSIDYPFGILGLQGGRNFRLNEGHLNARAVQNPEWLWTGRSQNQSGVCILGGRHLVDTKKTIGKCCVHKRGDPVSEGVLIFSSPDCAASIRQARQSHDHCSRNSVQPFGSPGLCQAGTVSTVSNPPKDKRAKSGWPIGRAGGSEARRGSCTGAGILVGGAVRRTRVRRDVDGMSPELWEARG